MKTKTLIIIFFVILAISWLGFMAVLLAFIGSAILYRTLRKPASFITRMIKGFFLGTWAGLTYRGRLIDNPWNVQIKNPFKK